MTALSPAPAIRRIPIQSGQPALELAALAWSEMERGGQLAAVAQLAAEGKADELVLVAALRGPALVGAALGQVLAGRAAVVWAPQLAPGEVPATAAHLLDALERLLIAADVRLAQTIVENRAGSPADTFLAAGFEHAGDLLYMAAGSDSFPSDPPRLEFELESYAPANHDRLLWTVEATYRGSLDCPLIDGLRETADVLAGYRAIGQFQPELWFLARQAGRDVGCLLLADHPAQDQMEIVYLGVVPQYRGAGWGRLLTEHAQWLARKAGRSRLVLAVDAANSPAVAAYRAAGFIAWDQRSVLVRSFRLFLNHLPVTA